MPMPTISFDVLVPDSAAGEVHAAFQRACDILVRRGMVGDATVTHDAGAHERISAHVLTQLRATYVSDRGANPSEDGARVHRFDIRATGVSSYNSLAMGLSRVLTPKAQLPADPVALTRQERFEVASIYPWTVEVRR